MVTLQENSVNSGFGWLNMASTVNSVQISHFSKARITFKLQVDLPEEQSQNLGTHIIAKTPLSTGCISELGPGLGKSLCTDHGAGAEFLALVQLCGYWRRNKLMNYIRKSPDEHSHQRNDIRNRCLISGFSMKYLILSSHRSIVLLPENTWLKPSIHGTDGALFSSNKEGNAIILTTQRNQTQK
ncbi:hypothetical protein U0070_011813, partial [Myodes glareolus]